MKKSANYPTLLELEQYNFGTLDSTRCHEIELLALQNQALADAIEGFEKVPYFQNLPHFKEALSIHESRHIRLIRKTPWHLNSWMILLLSESLVAIFILVYMAITPHQKSIATSAEYPLEHAKEVHILPNSNDLETPDLGQKNKLTNTDKSLASPDRAKDSLSSLPVSTEIENQSPDVELSSSFKYVGLDLQYINNFKVLDYSEIFENNYPDPERLLKSEMNESSGVLAYKDFLKIVFDIYKAEEYHSCNNIFTWMLQQHPDDINAKFYQSMCYYKMGDYPASKKGFEELLNSPTPVFFEDARRMLQFTEN